MDKDEIRKFTGDQNVAVKDMHEVLDIVMAARGKASPEDILIATCNTVYDIAENAARGLEVPPQHFIGILVATIAARSALLCVQVGIPEDEAIEHADLVFGLGKENFEVNYTENADRARMASEAAGKKG